MRLRETCTIYLKGFDLGMTELGRNGGEGRFSGQSGDFFPDWIQGVWTSEMQNGPAGRRAVPKDQGPCRQVAMRKYQAKKLFSMPAPPQKPTLISDDPSIMPPATIDTPSIPSGRAAKLIDLAAISWPP